MALTALQRDVCRLLAAARRESGESDVAVARSWDRDRVTLQDSGYTVHALRERPGFVEALVSRDGQELVVEWTRDSAFRFFPLVENDDLGLTLHPFDLATNKVLALVGRLEVRDWIDAISAHDHLQPLGYLAWAACGKDPGFTPLGILAHAKRSRYSEAEVSALAFDGPPPSAADLSRRWTDALESARAIIERLPADCVGQAVISTSAQLFTGDLPALEQALSDDTLAFHEGRIRGSWPAVIKS